ncbi:polyprenyl synthetase family protein [Ruicaihuangia caeni]|uniref:Polyprenyl synthetase family protein n=1 Tax=Ruicaihuangia caeni TaxID=3042517 RepID=A0AAW6T970_9MICO|nr:polyprenyl synthetase family protein [Klugiella sp. YN-L-19]MDI2098893.1 polyprenyl synthetase family protein [Klugiella sp. YN-L-19]
MIPTAPARRRSSLSASLGIGDRLFASADERRFARAIEVGLERVEAGLFDEMGFADELADVTARYLLDAGGKRVRPVLALIAAQLGDGATDEVITAARAIEITHLASLYHDDVMDEAPVRRGVPAAHMRWGNAVAILTGDLLFARASKLIASLGESAIALQADTFERLCLGQLHETVGPKPGEDAIEHYIGVLADKTGSLIAAAAQVGVKFSNAPAEFEQPVVEYGERVGVAFQLVDDVIDLAPPADKTGKTAGTDVRAGVATLPMLYLRQQAQTDAAASELHERITRDVQDGTPEEADQAITALRDHPVTERTLAEARRWASAAVAALEPLPEGPVKKALSTFADAVVERSS